MAKKHEDPKELRAKIAELRRRQRAARRLLDQALDALPDYMDGRSDKLMGGMCKWLEKPDA